MIRGVVVDRQERPVLGARIIVRPQLGPPVAQTESGTDGLFSVGGVAPGEYLATATSGSDSSAPVPVRTLEEEETSVHLIIEPATRIRGVVSSPWGPVPGAAILGLPRHPAGLSGMQVIRATTAIDGTFEVTVPAGSTAADVIVVPPGLSSRLLLLPVGDEPANIVVSASGGSLRVKGNSRGRFLLSTDVSLPLSLPQFGLRRAEVAMKGETSSSLLLEPGRYGVCTAPYGGGTCSWVVLSPGTEQLIDLGK